MKREEFMANIKNIIERTKGNKGKGKQKNVKLMTQDEKATKMTTQHKMKN